MSHDVADGAKPGVRIGYQLSKSYLQWARSILKVEIACQPPPDSEFKFPPNLLFALTSHAYLYSHMSIVAFVNKQLHQEWAKGNRHLRSKYSNAEQFERELRHGLGSLKNGLPELCLALRITSLAQAEPQLWTDLLEVVKESRDFFVHPKPDPAVFQSMVLRTLEEKWIFPIKTAENVLAYLYRNTTGTVPSWVISNQEYSIPRIEARF